MGAISAEDIISIIQSEIENFDVDNTSEETGTVIYVGDGIVTVYGIDHAMYGEVVVFDNGVKGMVQDIRQNEIGVILFGRDTGIKEGTKVVRTKKKAGIPVGNEYIGRVINALGEPIDGGAEIKADGYRPIEEEAPGIIERKSVDTPMETGILSIDSMFPIGRGQRELIIGDRQTGKTSIATSIAQALKRKFVRASLGGVRDEAEIRGHRRTYVGAMPGRIIEGIKNVGSKDPLFLLDEVDKMASDYRGDPVSALLEVLDPEQYSTFSDHYIGLAFDLSKVMWIITANDLGNIPRPLRDRMEIIMLPSYTEVEKMHIAKEHLLDKVKKANGLKKSQVNMSDEVISKIIEDYTREAGVRELERQLSKACRKAAYKIVTEKKKSVRITKKNITDFLGKAKYTETKAEKENQVGLCTGLAWTEVGGVILPVEVAVLKGKGNLLLTGQLGDVMKESGRAALTCIRARSEKLKIDEKFYEENDIHVHFPEGAVPKDGPSAGITMTTAIVSALTDKKVRADVAMTGEITLRGKVLPIGGLKEKSLAAYREGIYTVIMPKANERDLDEIAPEVKAKMKFIPVETIDEVLKVALVD